MAKSTPAISTSKTATVKMVRPEDRQAQPCVAEVAEHMVAEFEAEGWVVKSDAEIEEMLQARAPKTEAKPEAQAQETAQAPQAQAGEGV